MIYSHWLWLIHSLITHSICLTLDADWRLSPEGHDVAVGAETSQTHAQIHLHHVRPQDERRLRDAVFVDAGLRGEGDDFGLFLRTHHGVLALVEVLRGGRGHGDGPALADLLSLFAVCRDVGFKPGLVGGGQHRPCGVQDGHPHDAALQSYQHAWWTQGKEGNWNLNPVDFTFFHRAAVMWKPFTPHFKWTITIWFEKHDGFFQYKSISSLIFWSMDLCFVWVQGWNKPVYLRM